MTMFPCASTASNPIVHAGGAVPPAEPVRSAPPDPSWLHGPPRQSPLLPPMRVRVSLSGEDPRVPALRGCDGIGLLRGEFLFRARGEYPNQPAALAHLRAYLEAACAAHPGRPVWYRICDFWSDEAAVLRGNPAPRQEANPLLGVRGIRAALADVATLRLELAELVAAADAHPTLHVLLPFVRDARDLEAVLPELRAAGFAHRIGAMVEIPSAAWGVERLLDCGVSNLLVGLNDLSCLMLGQERGDADAKSHASVWRAVDEVARAARGRCEWGIGGSLTPTLLDLASCHGADYVSIHYAELPALRGVPASSLPDVDWVRRVKQRARAPRRALTPGAP